MNPNLPQNDREKLEAQVTAFLLGELPPDETMALCKAMERDAELAALYEQLKRTIDLVRESASTAVGEKAGAALKLSEGKREKLLAQFKTIEPEEFARAGKRFERWIPSLAAAAMVMVLAALVLPALSGAKSKGHNTAKKKLDELTGSRVAQNTLGRHSASPPLAMALQPSAAPIPASAPEIVLPAPGKAEGEVTDNIQNVVRYAVAADITKGLAQLDDQVTNSFTFDEPNRTWGPGAAVTTNFIQNNLGFFTTASTETANGLDNGFTNGAVGFGQTFDNEELGIPPASHAGGVIAGPVSNERSEVPATEIPKGQIVLPPTQGAAESQTLGYVTGITAPEGADFNQLPMVRVPMGGGGGGGIGASISTGTPRSMGGKQVELAAAANSPGTSETRTAKQIAVLSTAEQDLETEERWQRVLQMKTGKEVVDTGLPRARIVTIMDPAAASTPEKSGFGEKLRETITGKVERVARISVELEHPDIGGQRDQIENGYDPYFLQTEFQTIQSDAVLKGVVESLKLDGGDKSKTEDAVRRLKKDLDVHPEKNSKFIDIGVESKNPQEAARLANAVAQSYRQYRDVEYMDLRRKGIKLLQGQLDEQDKKVAVAQAKVEELREDLKISDAMANAASPDERMTADRLSTRTFKIDPNKSYADLKISSSQRPAGTLTNDGLRYVTGLDPTTEIQVAVSNFFQSRGLDLTPPKAIFFNDRQGTLTIHAAPEDLEKIKAAADEIIGQTNSLPDSALPKPTIPPPMPQPEMLTRENAFSTFSMNVSDVSFKLAAASLEKGQMPEPASIRSEEFINAFDYRDPEAPPGVPIAFASERARYPFAHNRELLRFSVKTAAQGRQTGRPLNIVLLLDNSGSMERADRVRIIQQALRVLAGQLQAQDTFSIVTFARTARLRVDGIPGNQAAAAAAEISKLTPEGGTNLGEALDVAYETALHHYLANGDNRVVLLTDGAANLGDVDPDALKQKVEAHRKQGIALDCFGIGWEGYNDDLLEVLTRNGDGRYGFINTPEEAGTEFVSQIAGALHVAAADVKVQVEFNPKRVTSYRQIGYAKHQLTKEQFRDNTVDAGEIAAQEAGNALYTIEINPQGEGSVATVRVRYKVPGTTEYREQAWDVPYTGGAVALEQASPAMRLAATASAFSEWLAASPFATEVTTDELLKYLNGVPEVYGADKRTARLQWMIRQAKSISGK